MEKRLEGGRGGGGRAFLRETGNMLKDPLPTRKFGQRKKNFVKKKILSASFHYRRCGLYIHFSQSFPIKDSSFSCPVSKSQHELLSR